MSEEARAESEDVGEGQDSLVEGWIAIPCRQEFHRLLRKGNYAERVGAGAPVYLAASWSTLAAEVLRTCRNDVSKMFELANVVEEERNKRIQLLNEEIRAAIECVNEYAERSNELLTSLAHMNSSSNTPNFDELIASVKNEFREMFETYMKEFRFDDLNVDDIIGDAIREFAFIEPVLDLPHNSEEAQLLRKINEKKKQIEKGKIEHLAHMMMMQQEKEELERDIKILQEEFGEGGKNAYKEEDEEKQQLRNDIESLQRELNEIDSEIEKLRMS
uniref:Uncharacterized protein n=1 Tax=Parascaris univalens TaxID=6257 RepID=A0A915BQ25_PARUN